MNLKQSFMRETRKDGSGTLSTDGKKYKLTDDSGYYNGYCQCNCPKCREGKRHCQGLVCRGD
jgi:hypothetical protein